MERTKFEYRIVRTDRVAAFPFEVQCSVDGFPAPVNPRFKTERAALRRAEAEAKHWRLRGHDAEVSAK